MRPLYLGSPLGLRTTISPGGIASYLLIILPLAWLAAKLRGLTLGPAMIAGALSSAVIFFSDWLHQFGHARAALRVDYPMSGIHYHSLLSTSIYPADEPSLPPKIHIRRALGGFWVNVLIGLLIAPAAIILWPRGGVLGWLAGFSSVYNIFINGLGALLPIDIPGVVTIDGGTLLRYWRESREEVGKFPPKK